VKHVFFDDATGGPMCTPCSCGAPVGSLCTAKVSIYGDGTCTTLLATVPASSFAPTCFDVNPAGQAVGSTDISILAYQPGSCPASGGELTGAFALQGPTTFCCKP
jgi:hypothetical protein